MATQSNSNRNLYAALTYILGFITGIIFLLTSKDSFVRFHAIQSIGVSLAFFALNFLLTNMGLNSLNSLVGLASLAVVVILMVKAYRGEKFKVPIIGDFAEKKAS